MSGTISVIIPTWCEAAEIEQAVSSAMQVGDEVVVADPGSPDGTAELAARAGARVVASDRGRGAQLRAGAAASRGDVLLFLHADCRLPVQARVAIERALINPGVIGGNFRLVFEPSTPWARVFSWANDVRRRALRIYYGDSGIFLRRAAYERLGGFRRLPVFEDYDLVRRLERQGRTKYIREVPIAASARRFMTHPMRTLALWAVLQALFSAGVPATALASFYRDLR